MLANSTKIKCVGLDKMESCENGNGDFSVILTIIHNLSDVCMHVCYLPDTWTKHPQIFRGCSDSIWWGVGWG